MNIRFATPEDAKKLAELRWHLHAETHPEQPLDMSLEDFVPAFCQGLGQLSSTVHLLAESAETIVAVLSVVRVSKLPSPDDLHGEWGYLTNVYTRPDYRNRGVGAALLTHAQAWARQTGLELLTVWPSDASISFYQRAGFRRAEDPLVWNNNPLR
jgi:GNAT superfamily N-acetyltransferase